MITSPLLLVVVLVLLLPPIIADEWLGQLALDPSISYTLHYKTSPTNITLQFRAAVPDPKSWLGFGISEAGGMLGSDIVTVSIDANSGKPIVVDRFVQWVAYPLIEEPRPFPTADGSKSECGSQDWHLINGTRDGDWIEVTVTRLLVTNDGEFDRPFSTVEMNRCIWAHGVGDASNINNQVAYHGSTRGQVALSLNANLSAQWVKPSDAVGEIKLEMGWTLQKQVTQYICKAFDLGVDGRHVIAFQPNITSPRVHHVLLHSCGDVVGKAYSMSNTGTVLPCLSTSINSHGTSPLGRDGCTSLFIGWAPGVPSVSLPQDVGFKIGVGATRYLVMEFHIDNPMLEEGTTIQSSITLHTTSNGTFRTFDAGSMTIGDPAVTLGYDYYNSKDVPIPGNTSRVHYEASCPQLCTKRMPGPIQVFSSFLHMHKMGKELWSTHYDSNGKKLRVTSHTQFWTFANQLTDYVNFTVNPYDSFNTHCVYDTSKSTEVYFGSSSSEEMCMQFFFYYPKPNGIAFCGTLASAATLCEKNNLDNVFDHLKSDFSLVGKNPSQPDGDVGVPTEVHVGGSDYCQGLTGDLIQQTSGSGGGSKVGDLLVLGMVVTSYWMMV
jgi:hypothetical protein